MVFISPAGPIAEGLASIGVLYAQIEYLERIGVLCRLGCGTGSGNGSDSGGNWGGGDGSGHKGCGVGGGDGFHTGCGRGCKGCATKGHGNKPQPVTMWERAASCNDVW